MANSLKENLQQQQISALKAGQKQRLGVIRLLLAAVKQFEIDQRLEAQDSDIIKILNKQYKQRQDSIQQFSQGNRSDLVAVERFELDVISEFLPEPLSDDAINQLINTSIEELQASSPKDLGAVMAKLKPDLLGKADMRIISQRVKQALSDLSLN